MLISSVFSSGNRRPRGRLGRETQPEQTEPEIQYYCIRGDGGYGENV